MSIIDPKTLTAFVNRCILLRRKGVVTLKIKCGFSQVVITPEPNESFIDGFGSRKATGMGVQDDIMSKVCAIS